MANPQDTVFNTVVASANQYTAFTLSVETAAAIVVPAVIKSS